MEGLPSLLLLLMLLLWYHPVPRRGYCMNVQY